MNILKEIIEGIASVGVNEYKAGTHGATHDKLVYLDPTKLKNPDMAKNVAYLRKSLEHQLPGITGKPGDADYMTDGDLEDLVNASTHLGPFAYGVKFKGKTVGIVNLEDKAYDNKNKLMPFIAHVPLDKMKPIPGPNYLWQRAVGIHEGTHVDQAPIDPAATPAERTRLVIQREARSDQAAIQFLRKEGREDMAQALIDYRALGAAQDPTHATSIFLNQKGQINVTAAQADAAGKFKAEMDKGVALKLGISEDDARKLLDKDPRKYMDTTDDLLKKNAIGSTPEIKQYMEQYAGAYRRQIIDKDAKPQHANDHGHKAVADANAPAGTVLCAAPGLTQYYRVGSTTGRGGTLVSEDNTLAAVVRGENPDRPAFQLSSAWNAAKLADQQAVPGLIPPVPTPTLNTRPDTPAYRDVPAPQT